MNSSYDSISTLFGGEACLKILYTIYKETASSPSELTNLLGVSRGRIYSCINRLMRAGLIKKVGRGKYGLTRVGVDIVRHICGAVLKEGGVFTGSSYISVDEFLAYIKESIGLSIRDSDLMEALDYIKGGYYTDEEILLRLVATLANEGKADLVSDVARRTLFIKDFKRRYLIRELMRKAIEASFDSRIIGILASNPLKIEDVDKFSLEPYNVFTGGDTRLSGGRIVVKLKSDTDTKNIWHTPNTVYNLAWPDYRDGLYSYLRSLKRDVTYILHGVDRGFIDDELVTNMVLNDIERGLNVYLYIDSGDVTISPDGYGVESRYIREPIFDISHISIFMDKLDRFGLDLIMSRLFTRSLTRYMDVLRDLYGLDYGAKRVAYLCFQGINVDNIGVCRDIYEFIRDAVAEDDIFLYPFFNVDALQLTDYADELSSFSSRFYFRPRRYHVHDVFDLKYQVGVMLSKGLDLVNLVG